MKTDRDLYIKAIQSNYYLRFPIFLVFENNTSLFPYAFTATNISHVDNPNHYSDSLEK